MQTVPRKCCRPSIYTAFSHATSRFRRLRPRPCGTTMHKTPSLSRALAGAKCCPRGTWLRSRIPWQPRWGYTPPHNPKRNTQRSSTTVLPTNAWAAEVCDGSARDDAHAAIIISRACRRREPAQPGKRCWLTPQPECLRGGRQRRGVASGASEIARLPNAYTQRAWAR